MQLKTKRVKKPQKAERTIRKSKFQADLAPTEDRIVRALKQELGTWHPYGLSLRSVSIVPLGRLGTETRTSDLQ